MTRFREFINKLPYNVVLREEAPPNPDNAGGDETHNDVSSALKFQLGIEDDDLKQHDSEDAVVIGKPHKFARKWGFLVKPPITATVKHLDDGNVEVTFLLSQMPSAHFFNYKDGAPLAYEGDIEDKTEIMSAQDLEDIKATGLDQAGMMGGAGGMMGGMGDPMGGGMGAPPMGM